MEHMFSPLDVAQASSFASVSERCVRNIVHFRRDFLFKTCLIKSIRLFIGQIVYVCCRQWRAIATRRRRCNWKRCGRRATRWMYLITGWTWTSCRPGWTWCVTPARNGDRSNLMDGRKYVLFSLTRGWF